MKPISVREIIVNACDEARLVNRNQPIPGNIFESAYRLFEKRLNQYSNTNFLSFTRKETNFIPGKNLVTLGEYRFKEEYENQVILCDYEDALPDISQYGLGQKVFAKDTKRGFVVGQSGADGKAYYPELQAKTLWFEQVPDFEVENLQEVVRCYCKYLGTSQWDELSFVSYEDFYRFKDRSSIYSIKPISDSLVELYVPVGYEKYEYKVIYNEFFEFDIDSELKIPAQFISLFTAGLVYDLALQFPRLSDTTVNLLKQRLEELEENVRRSSAVNKFLARKYDKNHFTYDMFYTGKFLGL